MIDLKKYNQPVPRYTSYPTVPYWDTASFTTSGYEQAMQTALWESNKEVSLYIHLPFCESLCTYCACNTRITKNHGVEDPYIAHVLKEWQLYLAILPERPIIREIHLGGGTPTFFTPENLDRLIKGILSGADLSSHVQMSFEGHPANTTEAHLRTLYDLGFDRVSFGIQDFDEEVQRLIHRMQSFEQVQYITDKAREIGYTSVNYDVVYGLPGQHLCSLNKTLDLVNQLSPDRIAFYSYAHVPTMRPAQRAYEASLPQEDEKYSFMQLGKEKLLSFGYEEVGMDHFVKPEDELMVAQRTGQLHRNFMGYTPYSSKVLIGLGASSIGDCWTGFAQNEHKVEDYYARVDAGQLPFVKGHLHTREDLFFRKQILQLMCTFRTTWLADDFYEFGKYINVSLLDQLHVEGLIVWDELAGVRVLPQGRPLIRVICTAFDARLTRSGKVPQFSRAI